MYIFIFSWKTPFSLGICIPILLRWNDQFTRHQQCQRKNTRLQRDIQFNLFPAHHRTLFHISQFHANLNQPKVLPSQNPQKFGARCSDKSCVCSIPKRGKKKRPQSQPREPRSPILKSSEWSSLPWNVPSWCVWNRGWCEWCCTWLET